MAVSGTQWKLSSAGGPHLNQRAARSKCPVIAELTLGKVGRSWKGFAPSVANDFSFTIVLSRSTIKRVVVRHRHADPTLCDCCDSYLSLALWRNKSHSAFDVETVFSQGFYEGLSFLPVILYKTCTSSIKGRWPGKTMVSNSQTSL